MTSAPSAPTSTGMEPEGTEGTNRPAMEGSHGEA